MSKNNFFVKGKLYEIAAPELGGYIPPESIENFVFFKKGDILLFLKEGEEHIKDLGDDVQSYHVLTFIGLSQGRVVKSCFPMSCYSLKDIYSFYKRIL